MFSGQKSKSKKVDSLTFSKKHTFMKQKTGFLISYIFSPTQANSTWAMMTKTLIHKDLGSKELKLRKKPEVGQNDANILQIYDMK